jgi:hypothetical protein
MKDPPINGGSNSPRHNVSTKDSQQIPDIDLSRFSIFTDDSSHLLDEAGRCRLYISAMI